MKKLIFTIIAVMILNMSGFAQELKSPNGNLSMQFYLQKGGEPTYTLTYKGKEVIKPSKLGLELVEGKGDVNWWDFEAADPVDDKLKRESVSLFDKFSIKILRHHHLMKLGHQYGVKLKRSEISTIK